MTNTRSAIALPANERASVELIGQLRSSAARGSMAVVTGQALRVLIGLVAAVTLARILAPADFGLVAMALAVTGFITLFRELGLSSATIQAPRITDAQITTLFWINILGGVVLATLAALISPAVAWFFGDDRLRLITLALAPIALLGAAGCQHRALLRRKMRFGVLAAIDVAALLAGATAGIWTAANGGSYWALVVMPVVTELVGMTGVWLACRWRPGPLAPLKETRALVEFGRHVTGFEALNYWARNADNLLIGRIVGATALGLYSRAYQLMLIPIELIAGPIGQVATSTLSRINADAPDRYRIVARSIIEKIALVTMPVGAAMITCPDWIIAVAFGDQWSAAAPLLAMLGIAAVTQPIGHASGWLLVSQGRSSDLFRWGAIGSTLTILSFVAGLPWGALGVAAAYAIVGAVVRLPLLVWFVGRRGPLSAGDYAGGMIIPALGAAVCGIAILALRGSFDGIAPLRGLILSLVIAPVAAVIVISLTREGRRILEETGSLARSVLTRGGVT